ncbi:MAG: ComEC/Rec2 family competence protein, partial [Acidobacteriaceae bacterium]
MAAATIPQTSGLPAQAPVKASSRAALIVRAPALFAAICFAAGVLAAKFVWAQPGQLLIAILLLFATTLVAMFRAERVALGAAAVLCALLGGFCAETQPHPPPNTPLSRIAWATPTPTPATRREGIATTHAIEGTIVRVSPVRGMETLAPYSDKVREEQSQQLDVRVVSVDGQRLPAAEGLRLTLYAGAGTAFPGLRCGEALRGDAEMHTEERFLDPGVWDAGAWLRQQGISALGSAHLENVTATATNQQPGFWCRLHSLQQAASERVMEFADGPAPSWIPTALRLTHDDAAMLTAMLTGDRTLLGRRLRAGFERTGSFHLLVVSGMHLAIFSGVVFWIARRLRLPRAGASLATILLSLAYALFTGFGQPVQRAFWMVTLYLVGRMLWRERRPMNAIGFAALVMLAVNPAALFEAGLQMTLLSVFAVAGIAVPVAERTFGPYLRATRNLWLVPMDPTLPPGAAQFRVYLRAWVELLRPLTGTRIAYGVFPRAIRFSLLILELLTTSLAIELMMTLPMAVYFHRITAVALPVNILIVPLLGILLPLALATLALVLLAPKIALAPAMALALLLHGVSGLVHAFGAMRLGD